MFIQDPFDIAPNARRHTRASWLTLAFGLVFAAMTANLLHRSWQTVRSAEETARKGLELVQAHARSAAAARLKQVDPLALEKLRAQQKLQDMLRTSWSGLFDALESAGKLVDGRVTVVALAPVRSQSDAAEVSVTALAVSNEVMLDYIRALDSDTHVREVQLSTQQPTTSAGVAVIGFQLSILWEPRGNAGGMR